MARQRGGVPGFLAAGVATAAVLAQTPAPPQPTFRTEANYVRVDVYPTRDGAPVADLTRDDIEILDNGQPQAIDRFEHIQIRAAGPSRVEPGTVAESRSMLENPRARVFVLFLDTYHVDVAASHRIREPLVHALDGVLGADDLIAVMTPEMSPDDMTFAPKTTTIAGMLERYWHWGERSRLNAIDPEDDEYIACYPESTKCPDQKGIAEEMIARRHEKRSLDALQDLVRHLRGVREERKAILAISNGWLLFRPDHQLMRPLKCQGVPSGPDVTVDPRSGRLTTREPPLTVQSSRCSIDRTNLAQIDDEQQFREILDEANRANASFYSIDPRGLAVFDTPIAGRDGSFTPPGADRAMLTARLTSLRTLAEATDGLAIVDSNALENGLRRVVDDLTSYYLIGYYSSAKLDGKFHTLAVRVKKPGVQVRARRGYLAATAAEATRAAKDAGAPPTPAEAETLAIESVLSPLRSFSREASLRLRAAAGWTADGKTAVWLTGELGSADSWKLGAEADVTLSKGGETLATGHAVVPPGSRSFKVALAPGSALQPGDYTLGVRTRATSLVATSSDVVPLPLPAAPAPYGSLLVRRGPFTGLKEVPTADLRFRRSERLRVEIPASAVTDSPPSARLLDRNGKPMAVPVAASARQDTDGMRWLTGELQLTPLGPGDYIVEIAAGSTKTLTPFRIVP